jgi:hypothetical protein
MDYKGKVVRKPFAAGTKSEHEAVVLVTDGEELLLRRQGGNPFSDPELDGLVGKQITCKGIVRGYTLIMSGWSEAAESGSGG